MAQKANARRETEHCSLAVGRPLQCLAVARPTVTEDLLRMRSEYKLTSSKKTTE